MDKSRCDVMVVLIEVTLKDAGRVVEKSLGQRLIWNFSNIAGQVQLLIVRGLTTDDEWVFNYLDGESLVRHSSTIRRSCSKEALSHLLGGRVISDTDATLVQDKRAGLRLSNLASAGR